MSAEAVVDEPDGQLLRRFAERREEAAFAELVRRHGRLVWGVCRRRLARREDAEDAFQATFLILAVKAGTVRAAEALPAWLHRTACRAAVRVASAAPAAPADETEARGVDAFAELARHEAAVAVDEELLRLPRRYREALVLFHLDDLDRKAVAERLGASEATVKALLARGRALLRSRLVRRGLALPVLLPFLADPVPAQAAAGACRLGLSVTRGGVSALDMVNVPWHGANPMLAWLTGKSAAAALATAACLTLLAVIDGPPGNGTAVAGEGAETRVTADEERSVPVSGDAPAATAPAGSAPAASTGGLSGSPAEEKIRQALDQATRLEFPNTPLRDVLVFLADMHDINVILDEPALTEAGVNIDDNVDIVLGGITLRSGLRVILEPYDLTYVVRNEVLVVTTERKAATEVDTRSYDVSSIPESKKLGFDEKLERLLGPAPAAAAPADSKSAGPPTRVVQFGDRLVATGSWADQDRLREILDMLRKGR